MNKYDELIRNNIKFLIFMLVVITLGLFGIAYALNVSSFNPIGINTTTSDINATIVYENGTSRISSEGSLLPVDDSLIEASGANIENDRVLKVVFSVTGDSNNPQNSIYDIVLRNVTMDCELKNTYFKWALYKDNATLPISKGSFSPTFDAMSNDRLVLTNRQLELVDGTETYTLLIWISESCSSGDLSNCDSSLDQSSMLGRTFNASIMIEVATGSRKNISRVTSPNEACNYTSVTIPACNILTYNSSSQVLVNEGDNYKLENTTGTLAGTYYVTAILDDGYKWSDGTIEDKALMCSIDKKSVTIATNSQSISYGDKISSTTSDVTVTGLLTGHSLSSIYLSSLAVDEEQVSIVAGGAKIVDISGNDITSNYNITYNNSGVLSIIK